MCKKLRKYASNGKNTDRNVFGKRKQNEYKENKYKSIIAKDKNLILNSKLKKNAQKLKKKLKQVHKDGGSRTFSNFVDSDIVQEVNIKNKVETKKTKFQGKNKMNQHEYNGGKQHKEKKRLDRIPDRSNKKISINKNSIKRKNNPRSVNQSEVQNGKNMKHKKKKEQETERKVAKLNPMLQSKMKRKKKKQFLALSREKSNPDIGTKYHNFDIKRLKEMLIVKQKEMEREKKNAKPLSLRERMMIKLKASRFRYLNETLYNGESSESKQYFKNDPDAFKAYHEGYRQQVAQWPINPLNIIISSINKMPKEYIIADFGCGEANLAASVTHKVHSFDFVSLNENVTVCDIAHTPLLTNGVQVVVFCLSLMGTNLKDYIIEANRVLKKDGILKIAEVESRFEQVEDFIKVLSDYGFKNTWKDLSHNLFYFLDFKKEKDISGKRSKLAPITLKPCLYKKR